MNTYLNWIKVILVLKFKNLVLLLVEFFNLVKILDLIKFVFLELDKMSFKSLLSSLLISTQIDIRADLLNDPNIFSIKVNK